MTFNEEQIQNREEHVNKANSPFSDDDDTATVGPSLHRAGKRERERERNEISLGIFGSREGRRSDFGSELFN